MHGKPSEKRENWLLIKADDEYVLKGKKNETFLDRENVSVISTRTLEEIKSGKKTSIASKKTEKNKSDVKTGALQKKYGSVALATLVEFPPSGKDWLHEIKYDGYRLLAFINEGSVILQTRGGKDWTHKFPQIAAELAVLEVENAVLDGEACVLNEKGQTSFAALQEALSVGKPEPIETWLFDLLYLNGTDYTGKPLSERKAKLEKILANAAKRKSRIHYSEHFESTPGLLEKACKIGAEGLVSKRKDSIYQFRRTHDWVKSKCGLEQEFVIGGFMPAKDNPKAVGSLLLGYYRGKEFRYAGKVGTGYGRETAKEIYKKLAPLQTSQSPFPGRIEKGRRGYIWVRPEQLCEISFWEWTPDGHIRHASFKGLREDKDASEVKQEKPQKPAGEAKRRRASPARTKKFTVEGVVITHPDREVFPGSGITKGEIAAYYADAMPYFLPFAQGRLLSLLRCTETIAGECFFQRAPMKGAMPHVHGLTETHKGNKHNYLYTESPEGIIELAQMGTIEFHAWQSKVKNIGKPDQIIFDLDPSSEVPFEAVKLAALDVRNRLETHGLQSFARITGGKGIHIVAPIMPKHNWDKIKKFTQDLALQMQNETPAAYIATMSKQKRKGRIFVDYLRNEYSSTAIVPFSLRARTGAPVAVPVSWSELKRLESAAALHFGNIRKRMNASTRKMIEEFLNLRQNIEL
jgi:bifunctional non-homologous end joining protein LigD